MTPEGAEDDPLAGRHDLDRIRVLSSIVRDLEIKIVESIVNLRRGSHPTRWYMIDAFMDFPEGTSRKMYGESVRKILDRERATEKIRSRKNGFN